MFLKAHLFLFSMNFFKTLAHSIHKWYYSKQDDVVLITTLSRLHHLILQITQQLGRDVFL
jgi:hypothetical protein